MDQNELGIYESNVSELPAFAAGSYDFVEPGGRSSAKSRARCASRAELYPYRIVKRVMDLLLIVLAAPILLPALAMLALAVRFTSPGPVLFAHRRICKGGAFFSMLKFRTMCVNSAEVLEHYLAAHPEARQEWNRTHKLQADPRVTPVGRILRRLSLDELPQVWNVLNGQMSLVGPRPIVAAEVEKYGDRFRHYASVKPGVTGLWQVSGRSSLSYDQRVKLDCDYATQWTLQADLRILALTFRSVVNQEGAY